MSDSEQGATVVELLLREPEIVAWLDDYRRPEPVGAGMAEGEDDDDHTPPWAA